ncbi:hypothetical protein ACWD00_06110 [Streptomyces viridiviolaceus]
MATIRRSARLVDDPGWAARLTEPVLDVGERWSDTALADIAAEGPAWRDLELTP